MAYKGRFSPKNPKKYRGDPTNIIYRSLWELRVMKWLDEKQSVIEWASEEIAIPYISPEDGRWHRYFPDFLAKMQGPNGQTKTVMIEVKPKHQTKEPVKKKKITKQYIKEVVEYGKNQAKWAAAREYCLDKGYEFVIITEDHLGIK